MLDHRAATTLDGVFRALSDPARRTMVARLSRGPASVSELAEPFEMSLAGVMQHLRVLEESGLVRTEKTGRVRTCRLDVRRLSAAEKWLSSRRADVERRLDRLGALLDEEEERERKRR